jgi:predicted GIY-YIG superfamily endonuclease
MLTSHFVYILTNWDDSVMYIGVTNDLVKSLKPYMERLKQRHLRRSLTTFGMTV